MLEGFDRIGVAAYLPTFPRRKRYAGRVRTSRIPLFSGYLFYDSASILRAQVMRSYGVVRTLDADDDLLLANELTSLSRLLSIEGVVPRRIPLGVPGTPVEVTHGPFAGCRGHLVRVTGLASLVLRITFLGFGAEVEIDESVVRALPSEPGI